jgi:hypothetical protein
VHGAEQETLKLPYCAASRRRAAIRWDLAEKIRSLGWDVLEASSVDEAIKLLSTQPCPLIWSLLT